MKGNVESFHELGKTYIETQTAQHDGTDDISFSSAMSGYYRTLHTYPNVMNVDLGLP